MKAVIEDSDGLYIIRIHENNGSLCDVQVVEEIELMGKNQGDDLRFLPRKHI